MIMNIFAIEFKQDLDFCVFNMENTVFDLFLSSGHCLVKASGMIVFDSILHLINLL